MQSELDDLSLLEKIKQDDTRALDALFNRYYIAACSVLFYFLKNKELAEELGADVFIRFWNKRRTIIITQNARGYLLTMARNAALAELEKKKHTVVEIETASMVASGTTPEQLLLLRELNEQVIQSVNTIDNNTRIIFSLSRDGGLKYREIAELLQISEKTVEQHMSKALRHLREKLITK